MHLFLSNITFTMLEVGISGVHKILKKYIELLIFNIGLGFSSMSPLISVFAVIYFSVAYFRAKYNYIYVYAPNFNEGLKMMPLVINRVFTGMYIYQITLLGVLSLKVCNFLGIFKKNPLIFLIFFLIFFNTFLFF